MPTIFNNKILNIPTNYPADLSQSPQQYYQYQLNLLFDLYHPLGGIQIDSPQEWWCLFEEASAYLACCDQKHTPAIFTQFLQLILDTAEQHFGLNLSKDNDLQLLLNIFQLVNATDSEQA